MNVIMHLIYFTPEITDFLKRKDFSLEKQYLILFNLKTIMEKYSKLLSDNIEEIPEKERYIDVKELRKSIELLYKGENLFKMGQNGDPADLLFLFLNSIHSYYMKAHSLKYSIEKECNPLCPSHEFFWLNLVQQYECQSCKGTSDILKFDYNFFIYEIFMKKIIFKVQKLKNFDQFHNKFFLFSKEINSKTRIDCPSKCKNPNCLKNIIVIDPSPYIFISVSWKETNPKLEDICKFFFMLPKIVSNSDIFTVFSKDLIKNYLLYGIICYWAGHYVCFFQSNLKEEGAIAWYFIDDKNIQKIKSWKELIIHCIKHHYHPIMLFYKVTESKTNLYDQPLNDKDYLNLIKHCQKVDEESQTQSVTFNQKQTDNITNKNYSRTFTSKIRPMIEMKKSTDEGLIRSLKNLQKLDEIKKKGSKDVSSVSRTNSIYEKKSLNEEEEKKKEEIGKNEWICKKCENINNYSTFQCNKCKSINIKVYEKIANKKEIGLVKINTDTSSKKYDSLSRTFDKEISKDILINTIMSNISVDSNSKNISQFKKNTSNVSLVNNIPASINESEELSNKNKEIIFFKMNEDHTWNCPYCNFRNDEENVLFCENCKMNKPKNEETVKKDIKVPTINSVKHYL